MQSGESGFFFERMEPPQVIKKPASGRSSSHHPAPDPRGVCVPMSCFPVFVFVRLLFASFVWCACAAHLFAPFSFPLISVIFFNFENILILVVSWPGRLLVGDKYPKPHRIKFNPA